ncbi:vacuolar protein sorting-associated protein 33B-like [Lineus longissimus]|uniref:vacuolar protein sorting-associated protein 33B-like n=1 Tax=Lineus longissimus TaxID=88925 RepID=UPI002B4FB21C
MAGVMQGGGAFPDFDMLRIVARGQLKLLLESMPELKDLIIEQPLMKPLDRIAGAQFLKSHGVDKIYKLEPSTTKALSGCRQRMYLIRPSMKSVKCVADTINADIAIQQKRKYKIIFVPKKCHVCERILEQEGVFGHVSLDEFHLDLIPLDRDLLSLEMPGFFKSFFLENDQSWLHTVAKSLVSLQDLYGIIPNVYGVGRGSKISFDLMNMMLRYGCDQKRRVSNEIGHVFLIDRDIDFVTPLLSQVTYEGLVDETFGIKSGFVEFGPEITRAKTVRLLLTSDDEVFEEIRNRHFSNVFGYLGAKARELQSGYDKRHGISSVSDMKNFVSNELKGLKQQHKSLALHIGASEVILGKKNKGDFEELLTTEHNLLEGIESRGITNYIEECIHRQLDKSLILRHLCLFSQTNDGLPPALYKSMRTQFLHSHGFEHLLTFHNLKKIGLLTEQEKAPTPAAKQLGIRKSSFQALRKKLNLVPKFNEDFNLKNPSHMAYVFSGAYTPLSCKLIEQVISREGFTGLEDVMKHVPEPVFSEYKVKSARATTSSKVILVYFVGGCTYSEVVALRFLGKLKGWRFIIATSEMLNGRSLMDQVVDTAAER